VGIKLVVGCGYLGGRVARLWRNTGAEVHVVTRSDRRANELSAAGYRPWVADIVRGSFDMKPILPEVECVLFSVGFDRTSGQSIEEVFVRGLQNVLDALPERCGKFIQISSTGVYGQKGGEWVDEDSDCRPVRAGGRACLSAEQALFSHRFGGRAIVLRMAGLYGPGRIPHLDQLARCEPLAVPAEGFLNLIHVDDAARAVRASELHAAPPRIYCVSDGHPVERRAYYAEVARQIGASPPTFCSPSAALPATSRAVTSKRVVSRSITRELGFVPQFADYRTGIRNALAHPEIDRSPLEQGSVADPRAET
jgi:nucleoside-diphosphate-sugar epimerase